MASYSGPNRSSSDRNNYSQDPFSDGQNRSSGDQIHPVQGGSHPDSPGDQDRPPGDQNRPSRDRSRSPSGQYNSSRNRFGFGGGRNRPPGDENRSSRFSLAVILPLFVIILIALSFALAIATAASPRWASKRAYSNSSDLSSYLGVIHRNPFSSCIISLSPPGSSSQADNQTCISPQYDTSVGGLTYNLGWDTPLLCDTLKLASNLLIAGCVLLGVALIVSLGLFAFGILTPASAEPGAGATSRLRFFGHSLGAGPTSFVALFLFLLVIPAAFCIAIAQLLGAWALLTLQLPNARFGRPGTPSFLGAWYADQGLSLAAAAWVCAGFGALFVPLAWRLPRGFL